MGTGRGGLVRGDHYAAGGLENLHILKNIRIDQLDVDSDPGGRANLVMKTSG